MSTQGYLPLEKVSGACVLEKAEALWGFVGEKSVFTQWYLLLMLSHRSCTSQPGMQVLHVSF